jgi:hypothetical protein
MVSLELSILAEPSCLVRGEREVLYDVSLKYCTM